MSPWLVDVWLDDTTNPGRTYMWLRGNHFDATTLVYICSSPAKWAQCISHRLLRCIPSHPLVPPIVGGNCVDVYVSNTSGIMSNRWQLPAALHRHDCIPTSQTSQTSDETEAMPSNQSLQVSTLSPKMHIAEPRTFVTKTWNQDHSYNNC